MFSFVVFGEGYGFWGTLLAFLIHQAPACIVIIVLVLAWRWEWIGAVLYNALAVFYLITTWGKLDWIAYVLISGPLFLMGGLFLLNWIYRTQLLSIRPQHRKV
jgi:glucose-6-phosphate-specific signal transduction histidine kinase